MQTQQSFKNEDFARTRTSLYKCDDNMYNKKDDKDNIDNKDDDKKSIKSIDSRHIRRETDGLLLKD